MFIDDLLERNRAFVAHHPAKPLPTAHAHRMAVLACFDPRLDTLLRPALGFAEDEGFIFRTAGAVVTPHGKAMRSLALAVYMFEVREILVLGHSSCAMASFSTSNFIEAFRSRGVAREAFGDQDLRTWAGATANPRQGVLGSASAIAAAPFLPNDLAIAGAVLDDTTGKIEVVLKPGETIPGMAPAPAARRAEQEEHGPKTDVGQAMAETSGSAPPPPPVNERPAPARPAALPPALEPIHTAVDFLATQSHMYAPLAQLRHGLKTETNPLKQLALIQRFVQSGVADSKEMRDAFKAVRKEVGTLKPRDLLEIFTPLLERKKS